LATAALILTIADAVRQVFNEAKPDIGALTWIAIGLIVISPVWTITGSLLWPPAPRVPDGIGVVPSLALLTWVSTPSSQSSS
jgi:hypothetical protein